MELTFRTPLPVPAARALAWHRRPGAFERLSPPWVDVRVGARTGGTEPGDRVRLRVRKGPVAFDWTLEHARAVGGEGFADVQVQGPFAAWRHDHLFADEPGGSVLTDRVRFALPAPAAFLSGAIRRDLARLFAFRGRTLRQDLLAHARAGEPAPRTVLVSGAGGLVGSAVCAVLGGAGHRVLRLVRRATRSADEVAWDPARGLADPAALEGVNALIHLAGESIAGGLWTAERKRRIEESRTRGTRVLAEAVARAARGPRIMLSASAIGIYGVRGDEPLREEDAARGAGFFADVGRGWEAALEPARAAGVRTASLRLGLVLSPRGGLLGKLLLPFRLGLGGPLGDGAHWMSWVSRDDAAFAFLHALHRDEVSGAVNVTAPAPVTNADFTRILARVLGQPAFCRVPAALLRAISADMAAEVFLASQRVVSSRLVDAGFVFRDAALEDALRHMLGRAES